MELLNFVPVLPKFSSIGATMMEDEVGLAPWKWKPHLWLYASTRPELLASSVVYLLWSKWLAAGRVIFLSGAPTRCLKEIAAVRRWRRSVDLDVICVFVRTADPSLLQSLQADVTHVILTLFTLPFYEIQIPNVRRHMRTSSVFCRTLRSKWVITADGWWVTVHLFLLLCADFL